MVLRLPDAGDLARVSRAEFGVPLVSIEPVIGGWDEDAAVWEAVDEDGRRWSLKASRRDITFGLSVASSLVESGIPGIVASRRAEGDRPWAEERGALVTLSPWIDGDDASDLGAVGVDWGAFGRTLRAVHEHPAPAKPRPLRRGIRRSRRSAGELVAALDRRFATGPRDDVVDALRARWLEEHGRIDALVDAERTLKKRRRPTRRVTLHGDPHLGNVILDAAGTPWLIDFDESTVAPREVDLMLVELGVLFSVPIDEEQRSAFRAGYGEDAPIDEERLARFGAMRAVEDLVWTLHRALDRDERAPVDYDETLDGMLGAAGQMAMVERALDRLGSSRTAPATPQPHPSQHRSTSKERS